MTISSKLFTQQQKQQQNERNEVNIDRFVNIEPVITSLLLTCKITTFCQFITYPGKQKEQE